MENLKSLKISCLCGAATHSFNVPLSALPLPTHLCSCNISRRISGSLLTSYINITFAPNAVKPDVSTCIAYKSSNILSRHFCSTCGTHMYLEYHDDGHFEAATGTLQVDSTDGIIKFEDLMWIEDTLDGGASQFITEIDDRKLKRFTQESGQSEEIPLDWMHLVGSSTDAKGELVQAHCHCNNVSFYITPPTSTSKTASSPFPDLLIPYHTEDSANPSNRPWWIPHPNRYLAGTCACTTCRRASGFDITFWAFIPTCNLFLDAACTIPFRREGRYWGSMKSYRSSANVTRTFCSTCGANIFWDGDERPSIVDVAVGLLDSKDGARAENVLAWWPGRVSFSEEALDRGLIHGLEQGLKDWAKRNQGKGCVAAGTFPKEDA